MVSVKVTSRPDRPGKTNFMVTMKLGRLINLVNVQKLEVDAIVQGWQYKARLSSEISGALSATE